MALSFAVKHPDLIRAWHDASNNLVLLSVPDEDSLMDLMDDARRQGIKSVLFYEPDFDDALTALAFPPGDTSRRFLSNLPLALKETALV